jgi:hypothetical protein
MEANQQLGQRRRGAGRFVLRLRGADAAVRRARRRESVQPQPGHQRDVSRADDHLDGRLVCAAARVFPRGGADHRLRRRGHRAVHVRHHAARLEGRTAPQNKIVRPRRPDWFPSASSSAFLSKSLASIKPAAAESPRSKAKPTRSANCLFTQYTLPFEIVSVLLLVAMIGVILLSKKIPGGHFAKLE